jgi:hypothetical protein
LLERCASAGIGYVNLCYGYLMALADMLAIGAGEGPRVCIPQGTTSSQLRDIYIRDARANPENRHLPAYVYAGLIIRNAYPCR